jgi:DNA-binding GntR family transcriptional regulator
MINHNTLRENIKIILKKEIVEGIIEPLSVINQVELSKRFGISRGPIREALSQLSVEGLVELNAYKKVSVTGISKKYVNDLYNVRNIIERFAIKELILKKNKFIVKELNDIINLMIKSTKLNNFTEIAKLDLRFHRTIINSSNNLFLSNSWIPLETGVMRCMYKRYKIYDSLEQVVGNHPLIIKTIEQNDIYLAESLISQHISEALEKILQWWDEYE